MYDGLTLGLFDGLFVDFVGLIDGSLIGLNDGAEVGIELGENDCFKGVSDGVCDGEFIKLKFDLLIPLTTTLEIPFGLHRFDIFIRVVL